MTRPTPLLYGHRGAPAALPENTLPSFRLAIEQGADAIETDVHLTADGHVVMSHDPSGERCAGVRRLIRCCRLAEVQSWDAGCRHRDRRGERPFAGRGYRIPTLREALCELPAVPFNVDLKQRCPDLVEPVLRLLRELGAEERVTLASYYDEVIRKVRRHGYRGPTALSRNEVIGLLALPAALRRFWPVRGQALQIPPSFGPVELSSRRFIARCHRLGLRVDYWTVNDPVVADVLLDRGADGLFSDDPAALFPVFRRYRRPVGGSAATARPAARRGCGG